MPYLPNNRLSWSVPRHSNFKTSRRKFKLTIIIKSVCSLESEDIKTSVSVLVHRISVPPATASPSQRAPSFISMTWLSTSMIWRFWGTLGSYFKYLSCLESMSYRLECFMRSSICLSRFFSRMAMLRGMGVTMWTDSWWASWGIIVIRVQPRTKLIVDSILQ